MVEIVMIEENHTLGVLEHGMYLKRMCERGRPLQTFKEEVFADKLKYVRK